MLAPWKKSYYQPRKHIKKQRHYVAKEGPSSQRYGFSSSLCMELDLDHKESWALKNWCFWTVVLTLESPLACKEILPVNSKGNQSWIFIGKGWSWSWNSNTLATWCEELTHWKRPWWWERLKAGGEGNDRGWDGWMASPTLWTWVWASSRSWWWAGKPDVLQSTGSQRVGYNWVTELICGTNSFRKDMKKSLQPASHCPSEEALRVKWFPGKRRCYSSGHITDGKLNKILRPMPGEGTQQCPEIHRG